MHEECICIVNIGTKISSEEYLSQILYFFCIVFELALYDKLLTPMHLEYIIRKIIIPVDNFVW